MHFQKRFGIEKSFVLNALNIWNIQTLCDARKNWTQRHNAISFGPIDVCCTFDASSIDYECDIPICETCYLYCRAHFIHKQLTHHRITFICGEFFFSLFLIFFLLLLLGCKRSADFIFTLYHSYGIFYNLHGGTHLAISQIVCVCRCTTWMLFLSSDHCSGLHFFFCFYYYVPHFFSLSAAFFLYYYPAISSNECLSYHCIPLCRRQWMFGFLEYVCLRVFYWILYFGFCFSTYSEEEKQQSMEDIITIDFGAHSASLLNGKKAR